MPPQQCQKCRNFPAAEGDTWCNGCSGWEALGRELCGSWDSAGARRLANDLVLTAARQTRALRSLAAGLVRQADAERGAGRSEGTRRSRSPERDRAGRESLPRRRAEEATSAKAEQESEEEEPEETDEEERRRSKRSPSDPPDTWRS